ncbi:TetR/AcrR family transcriptional regulator [Streptomyces sp. LP05-1]|uniref:TetR/AcrR family transcriptional regulator n=1 Tax=Streptomyces pyxinae TaxID=2970734 RepID=A0ABT2CKY8_9ACTN|nr:TetR/AcrR family transcriptional regulator [Streptomyces sp. LP05-1]MCS0638088.1 TetR/AcrR family transcriptional regulator [Streptomyces sp. LP05-1]
MSAAPAGGPTAKGLRRRADLLDAAERLLSASGGAQLTLRAVADEAGVRLGHLQHYFPARADLLAALLDRVLTTSLARMAERTGPSADGADPGAVLSSVLSDHDDPPLVRLFTEVWSMAAHDEAAAEAVRAFYAQYAGHVAQVVRRQVPALDEAGARARAEVFVMVAEGAALFRSGITGRRTPATDAALRHTLRTLLTAPATP